MKRDILLPNKRRAISKAAKKSKQRTRRSEPPLTPEESAARQRLQREAKLLRYARETKQYASERDVPEHARALDAALEYVRARSSGSSSRIFNYAPARVRFALRYSNVGRLFLVDPSTGETLVASGYGSL
jgi:hypothetical protein